jgi:hypothetical protein
MILTKTTTTTTRMNDRLSLRAISRQIIAGGWLGSLTLP